MIPKNAKTEGVLRVDIAGAKKNSGLYKMIKHEGEVGVMVDTNFGRGFMTTEKLETTLERKYGEKNISVDVLYQKSSSQTSERNSGLGN